MTDKLIYQDALEIAEGNIDWEKLKDRTILIAGATGYVPQFFVHGILAHNDLKSSNITIIAFCRNEKKANERFSKYLNRNDFKLCIGDVRDKIVFEDKIDYIINAASPAGVKASLLDPVATYNTNVLGNINLLELAKEKHAQYLYISSIDVYGRLESAKRFVENELGSMDILDTRNVYACSKRSAETLCVCYAEHGIRSKIVRPCQIMGGGIDLEDGRLHIDFIAQMLKGDEIVLKGDGTPKRTFIYITDAILGMLTILLEGKSGEAYNLCSEECEATVLELAQKMSGIIKDRCVQIKYNMETRKKDPGVIHAVSYVCGNSSKIRALGWNSHVTLEETCKRMMRYYGIEC